MTFPNYFSPRISQDGLLASESSVVRKEGQLPDTVPILSHLYNARYNPLLPTLLAGLKRLSLDDHHQYGLTKDQYQELLESVATLSDSYTRT